MTHVLLRVHDARRRSTDVVLAGAVRVLHEPTIGQVGRVCEIAQRVPMSAWERAIAHGDVVPILATRTGVDVVSGVLAELFPCCAEVVAPDALMENCSGDELAGILAAMVAMSWPKTDESDEDAIDPGDASDEKPDDADDLPVQIAFLASRCGMTFEQFCDTVTYRQLAMYGNAAGKMLRDVLKMLPKPSGSGGTPKSADGAVRIDSFDDLKRHLGGKSFAVGSKRPS